MPFVAPLFVPGDRPERFAKAAATAADGVIIDLEDAIAPGAKDAARTAMVAADTGDTALIVRVNGADTPWWEDDLAAVAQSRASAVMVPKAQSVASLVRVRHICGAGRGIIPLIETAQGMTACGALLRSVGVMGAAFGSLDYALDLGCDPDWEALAHARGHLVLTSRLCQRAAPIDGITTDFADPQAAGRDAGRAKRLGFGGKLVIHPAQVNGVLAAFLPSQEELAWAKQVLGAVDNTDGGVTSSAQEMIDRPVIERARRMVAQAGLQKLGTEEQIG